MTENTNQAGKGCHVHSLSSGEQPSEAVITGVAAVRGRSPLELAPLYDAVNPDALNQMIDPTAEDTSSLTVTFEYAGCRITVTPAEVQIELL